MDKYDIFIQAGQSNATGYGRGPVSEPFVPDDRILYLEKPEVNPYRDGVIPCPKDVYDRNVPSQLTVAKERVFDGDPEDLLGDFSLPFAKDYIQAGLLAPDRKLLIVRSAVGGTGFVYGQWERDCPLYNRMLDMTDDALALNPENRLMGVLWHQGEHEVVEGNAPARYHGQLLALIDGIRQRYHCPDLPFICGGFCDEWVQDNLDAATAIMRVIRDAATERGGIFVETDDLPTNHQKIGVDEQGDYIHFCRESLRVMGHRYFAAYRSITQK